MAGTAASTPISTYQTYLLYKKKTESTYKKLIDIKDTPDKGGAPEMIDVTTLSDKMRKNIPGIQSTAELSYSANYVPADFAGIKALEGEELDFAEALGGTLDSSGNLTAAGYNGVNKFSGKMSVYMTGGGVNEAHGIKITIANSSTIEYSTEVLTLTSSS